VPVHFFGICRTMKTIFRISCYVISVLACISVVALATSSSVRHALVRVLPESPAEPVAEAHEEGEEERHALALSDRALKNIGVTEQSAPAVALTNYEKTIAFPGTLVERPGRSSLTIPSPMAGVVSKVYRVPGDALNEGDSLFDIRFTHEELIRDQTELLSMYLKRDIVEQEIDRLKPLGDNLAPRAQRENEFKKSELDATIEAQRKALLLYGLTEEQIDDTISSKRDLIRDFTVRVPEAFANGDGYQHGTDDGFQLKELLVETGIRVTAGEALAVVADHCRLYVEGRAYASDQRLLEGALTNDQPVRVVFEGGHEKREVLSDLKIRYIDPQINDQSWTLSFFADFDNRLLDREVRDNRLRHWRFKPGQRCTVEVPFDTIAECFVLPLEAVVTEGPDAFIFEWTGMDKEKKVWTRREVHVLHQGTSSAAIANDGAIFSDARIARNGAAQLQVALTAGGGKLQTTCPCGEH
jgi:cobalt-zinc-cadmium efflux system membrane fusion protein